MRPNLVRASAMAGALLTSVSLAGTTASFAAPLTLEEARRGMLANLPEIEAARERVAASRFRAGAAGRRPNPTLAAGVENFGLGLGGSHRETTVELGQRFELGGDRGARAAIAGADLALAEADRHGVMAEALARVDDRFIAVWSLQEKAAIQLAFVDLAGQSARLAETRHRAGAAPRGEVLRASAELSLRRAEHGRTLADRRIAAGRLWALVGPGAAADSLVLAEGAPAGGGADASGLDLERHPVRLQAEAAARLAEAESRLARSARTPDLELAVGVRRLEEAGASGLLVSIGTTLPFWNPGGPSVAAADADHRAAQGRARGLARVLETERSSLAARLDAALEYERALREDVRPALASALEQIEIAYRAGRVSGLEPVEARRALRDTDLSLVDARAEVARTRAEISRWQVTAQQGGTRPEDGR